MNRVQVIGRLARKPERRGTGDRPVCSLRIAVPRRPKNNEDAGAAFIDVVTFGPLADTCAKHLDQGRQVAISGRLEQSEWTDKESGNRQSRLEIVADEVDFLDKPKSEVEANG